MNIIITSRIFAVFLSIIVAFMPLVSQAIPYNELVQDVSKKLEVSEKVAKGFIGYVSDFVADIQNNFTKIASHKTPRHLKNSLIEQTIEDYFEHPIESTVQISSLRSSLRSGKIRSYAIQTSIQTYLKKLSELDIYFETVELYFDRSYLSMGRIYSYSFATDSKQYEFTIEMWQMFKRCKREHGGDIFDQGYTKCYQDYSKITFHILFGGNRGSWIMRVNAITADKTTSSYDGNGVWNDDALSF